MLLLRARVRPYSACHPDGSFAMTDCVCGYVSLACMQLIEQFLTEEVVVEMAPGQDAVAQAELYTGWWHH